MTLRARRSAVAAIALTAIAGAASGLVADAMNEALGSVQQQARDVCQTPPTL